MILDFVFAKEIIMKKITKVKDKSIDGKIPNISISRQKFIKGLEKLRKQAKKEKRKLITDNSIEDYSG